MQLGASLPVADIGTGPTVVRDYAQAAEGLGYAYLVAPDHVLGVNPEADHAGRRVGDCLRGFDQDQNRRHVVFDGQCDATHDDASVTP